MRRADVPWGAIDAVFLDAGHTILCWDYAFAAELLGDVGLSARAERLVRAEAAARPEWSRFLAGGTSSESTAGRAAYVTRLVAAAADDFEQRPAAEQARVVSALLRALRTPEAQDRLWSVVPSGLPAMLERLRAAGLRLVVVSNSDGTVEAKLARAGIARHFDAIVDSHLVGAEKPDVRIFEHALARSGAARERTLHVGDLYHVDVAGARAAGLHAALLDPFDDWRDVDCARAPDVVALARELLAARGGSR
jgi:HAD superfamily hydrolase (TIGR01509 family)